MALEGEVRCMMCFECTAVQNCDTLASGKLRMPVYYTADDVRVELETMWRSDNAASRPKNPPSVSLVRTVLREDFKGQLVRPLGTPLRAACFDIVVRTGLGDLLRMRIDSVGKAQSFSLCRLCVQMAIAQRQSPQAAFC
jgi:hypothetical protein